MAVHVDVDARLNRSSIDQTAAEIKRDMEQRGDSAGQGFTEGFAKAVERDTNVRRAAKKMGDTLDTLTAAEAKRATALEKSKAVNEAVAASEEKLSRWRSLGFDANAVEEERKLTALREKQTEINNKLVVSTTAVTKAERDRAAAVRDAGDAYRKMGDDGESAMSRLSKLGGLPGGGGAIKWNVGLIGIGTLPAAATAITEVAGAVQQLAGAGLALPGIFAGVASSVGVGALGMSGMSDALDKISKADLAGTKTSVDAANKALANLSPTGAEVVKTVAGLKGTFTGLRDISSDNMFAGVSSGLKGLVAADLPAVTRGVDGISRGINQNLKQALMSLGSGTSQGFLDRIFGNTADAQSRLSAAIDPIVHAVGTLSAAGSDTLPRLADAVGKVAERFDHFISAADGDGRLKKWIDEGIDGFSSLGNTALNIGKSFTALTEAAGGGAGLLGTLESATGKMSAFLNSTEGQSKLRDYFAEGRDMLGQLKDVAVSSGPVLAGIFNAGISAASAWLPVIKEILQTINSIPGGAEAVVNAFIAWKTIAGIGALSKALGGISTLLRVTLPADAAVAGEGIAAGLSKALPIVGSIMAAVAVGAQNPAITPGAKFPDGTTAPNIAKDGIPDLTQLSGGGGQFGPSAADRWLAADQAANPGSRPNAFAPNTFRRRDGSIGTIAPGPDGKTPGISDYSAPAVTSGGSGASKPPYIDPSKYMMGDPLAGAPAVVAGADPQKVFEADSKVITDTHNLEQGRLALLVLEAKGNATQQELLTAKNNLVEQERALADSQDKDIKTRTNRLKSQTSQMNEIGVKLDQDLGISKGLAGIADNLVRFFGSLAVAPWEAKMNEIANAPGQAQGGFGLLGMLGAQGAFGSQFTAAGQAARAAGGASALGPAAWQPGGAYPGDAALLANVPKGIGQYDNATKDLSRGLVDCASGVEDLVNIMDGKSTVGGSLWTGNASTVLPQMGFLPGMGGPGDFRIGYNSHHMQATLPGGSNVNFGSTPAIQAGGLDGGQGAYDPSFDQHYYRPAGAPSGSAAAPTISIGAPGGPVAPSGFGGLPIPLPVTIVGGGGGLGIPGGAPIGAPGGGPGGVGGAADPYAPATPYPTSPASPGFSSGDITNPSLTNPPAPGASPGGGWGMPGLPTGVGGAGKGPFLGAPGPGVGAAAGGPGAGPTQIGGGDGLSGSGKGGIGASDSTMALAGMAASALDVMAPGAGQAAQTAMKLANRAIQYGGQVAGIAVQGAMDTFLPFGGSKLASNSWAAKLIGGIAGAAPALPNMAGKPAAPPPPGSPASGNGSGPAPGPGGDTNITVNNQRATEDGTGRDVAHALQNQYQPPAKP